MTTTQPTTPKHCERPMLAVKDNDGKPIWWCADCHEKLPRAEVPPPATYHNSVIRQDDKGLYCQGSGWRVRPVKPLRIFSLDAQFIAQDVSDKLGRTVVVRSDGTSSYAPGDHVHTHHYSGTQYVRVDGPKGTEIWFTAEDQPEPPR